MDAILIFTYMIIFLYGIVIGSFLNVCIYRIPKKENIAKVRSHCMKCGRTLGWLELIPLFSYIFQGGKCKGCGAKLSIQYPLIEAANGLLYVLVCIINGVNVDSLLYCLLTSALLVLSVIDIRTYEIPFGINVFIGFLGFFRMIVHHENWISYFAGFFAVSLFLYAIILITKGKGIGGGDMKLMAACGLFLGWKEIILAFLLGCIIASICHTVRMKLSNCSRMLAMGPYLSIGVWIAMLWGNDLINWYLSYF